MNAPSPVPPQNAADPAALDLPEWQDRIVARLRRGGRLGGLYATGSSDDGQRLVALVTTAHGFDTLTTTVRAGGDGEFRYPSLTPRVPAAFWYERALHDLSGIVPTDHPRLDPLLLPRPRGAAPPRPGFARAAHIESDDEPGPADVVGAGIFTLPFGPVRSGVFESIELLLETPGEDIPHLNIRPHYKHRGIAKQFEERTVDDGVLVAERVEGISSVAHALAYCHAVEALCDVRIPGNAAAFRVVYAELERIINHLDVTMRLCDCAGLAVATARFGAHKESLMRLVSAMTGSRFARGAVVPGGLRQPPELAASELVEAVGGIHRAIRSDVAALERSASFLDRLRKTGVLTTARAREHGALGPIGRASGFDDDDRRNRPYDAYSELPPPSPPSFDAGDAMARARVRWHEIDSSVALIGDAAGTVGQDTAPAGAARAWNALPDGAARVVADGQVAGWAEAAQGEALYGLEVSDGRIQRCFGRSASLHNLVLFHEVFATDIFTDLPFIEASFGLSYAGVAM